MYQDSLQIFYCIDTVKLLRIATKRSKGKGPLSLFFDCKTSLCRVGRCQKLFGAPYLVEESFSSVSQQSSILCKWCRPDDYDDR